jgi:hypothetical protein
VTRWHRINTFSGPSAGIPEAWEAHRAVSDKLKKILSINHVFEVFRFNLADFDHVQLSLQVRDSSGIRNARPVRPVVSYYMSPTPSSETFQRPADFGHGHQNFGSHKTNDPVWLGALH